MSNESIARAFEVANVYGCEPTWTVRCDQWWTVVIACEHGKYQGASRGILDPRSAFDCAAEFFDRLHPRKEVPAADLPRPFGNTGNESTRVVPAPPIDLPDPGRREDQAKARAPWRRDKRPVSSRPTQDRPR